MKTVPYAVILFAIAASPAVAEQNLPFVGSWAGGPTSCAEPFRFTNSGYAPPGQKLIEFTELHKNGRDYRMKFADGYSISLLDIKRNTLTWHSLASGDTFALIRCK